MMKKYKWSLLLGSLLSLSPILIGLLLWNQLPAKLPTHFSTGNTPDGWSSKAITVFGLPLFMFAMMWFCFLFTHVDPKRQNISPKLIRALVWFMAALSPIVVCSSYAIALGINVNITLLTYLIIGLMLLVIGNYLAKTKQNYSAGIRIPWTLSSEENWNRTHRVSSRLFIFCGLAMIANGFLDSNILLFFIMAVLIVIPYAYSFSREKENQKNQERDLVLEISGGEGMNDIEKQAFTLKDYEKVDEITDGQTFLYVVLPQFYSYKNENYEFVMILVDYKKLDLKNGYTYWGNGLQDIMNCEMNPIPQLEKKQMPTKIAELNWKTETDEIKLKKCVVAPITYMEQYKEEISSAAIHVEWKKKYLKNEEKTIQKIETYLYNSHDQSFRYRIYSPEIELRNNTIKVMTSLQAINKVALLFMAVFLTGMIAIYQLRFEHREESYGISLAYGAQYKELYWEIFCEILLLNSIGTIIGIVIGYLVTYYVDFGIMISVVNVQGSWYTFLSAYGLCVVLSSFVSVITFRKLKKKKIIELLNVY